MLTAAWIQTIILAITGWLVWKYTRETAKLGREMIRQNEINLRPVVVPLFERGAQGVVFKLANIGNGAAFNVEVRPLEAFRGPFASEELRIEFVFGRLSYLPGKQTEQVAVKRLVNGVPNAGPHPVFENPLPDHGQSERAMEILFGDVEGRGYVQRVRLKPPAQRLMGECEVELAGIERQAKDA